MPEGYEGNIASPANPYNVDSGTFGIDGSSSGFNWGGAGALALGAGALGYLVSQGPAPLPQAAQEAQGNVPFLESQAQWAAGLGKTYSGQGAEALAMAQKGELTPEQTAVLQQNRQGLQNTAAQTYASMGRNANQDTSFISTQGDIDAKINAMAQQEIQTTIQLGMTELQAGATFSGQATADMNAANQELMAIAQMQLGSDKNYTDALTGVFAGIAKMLPAMMAA